MNKRIITFLLAICMILSLMPNSSYAAEVAQAERGADYYWDFTNVTAQNEYPALTGDSYDGYEENKLTVHSGAMGDNGKMTENTILAFEKAISLKADHNWSIEVVGSLSSSKMLFSTNNTGDSSNNHFVYMPNGVLFGERISSGTFDNYGHIGELTLNNSTEHKFRFVNAVEYDSEGSAHNMIYIYVDDVLYASATEYYRNNAFKNSDNNTWVDGRDIVFGFMGSAGYELQGGIKTIEIHEGEVFAENPYTAEFVWSNDYSSASAVITDGNGTSVTLTTDVYNRFEDKLESYSIARVEYNGYSFSDIKEFTYTPQSYYWDMTSTTAGSQEVKATVNDIYSENTLTRNAGSINANGSMSGVVLTMETPVRLWAELPWVVEYEGKITGNIMFLATDTANDALGNTFLWASTSAAYAGYRTSSNWSNTGLKWSNVFNSNHVIRYENRIEDDGNKIYVIVDGNELGYLRYPATGDSFQSTIVENLTWITGRDFVFNNLGAASGHALNGTFKHVMVQECAHTSHTVVGEHYVCDYCGLAYGEVPKSYHWDMTGTVAGSQSIDGTVNSQYSKNNLTLKKGTINANGVLSKAILTMDDSVELKADLPWVVEYEGKITGNIMFLAADTDNSALGNTFLWASSSAAYAGYRTSSNWTNTGLKWSNVFNSNHVIRYENRIEGDSNKIYVTVDGNELGYLCYPDINGTFQSTTVEDLTWITGRDFVFNNLGATSSVSDHTLNGTFKHVTVQECSHPTSSLISNEYICDYCEKVTGRVTSSYYWDMTETKSGSTEIEAIVNGQYKENNLKLHSGSIGANGVLSSAVLTMDTSVKLDSELPWVVEYEGKITDNIMFLAADTANDALGNTFLWASTSAAYAGYRTSSNWTNTGLKWSNVFNSNHVIRYENRIEDDGNKIYVIVDGNELGYLRYPATGNSFQSTTSEDLTWITGRDFVFNNLGASSGHTLKGTFKHVMVQECSHPSYTNIKGQNLCDYCGYVRDDLPKNYYWEMSNTVANSKQINATVDDKYSYNKLTLKNGTIGANGVLSSAILTMDTPVNLSADLPWVVEYEGKINSNSNIMFLASDTNNNVVGATFLWAQDTGVFAGYKTSSNWTNTGFYWNGVFGSDHIIRYENRIKNGTNRIYVVVDGNELGYLRYYDTNGSTIENTTTENLEWITGRDFVFDVLGAKGGADHTLKGTFKHVMVQECSHPSYMSTDGQNLCTYCGQVCEGSIAKYYWDFQSTDDGTDALKSVTEGDYASYQENTLTVISENKIGANGSLDNVILSLEKAVELTPNRPWRVEIALNTSGNTMLLAEDSEKNANGNQFIGMNESGVVLAGEYVSNTGFHENYGLISGGNQNKDIVLRLENTISTDNKNMVFIYVNDKMVGTTTHYYQDETDKEIDDIDWINGRDFEFGYLGNSDHPLNGTIKYIEIHECTHSARTEIHDGENICVTCGEIVSQAVKKTEAEFNWTNDRCGASVIIKDATSGEILATQDAQIITEERENEKEITAITCYDGVYFKDVQIIDTTPPKKYHWDFTGAESGANTLAALTTDEFEGYSENTLTVANGASKVLGEGSLNDAVYKITTPIKLRWDYSWTVEVEADFTEAFMFLSAMEKNSAENNTFFWTNGDGGVWSGECISGSYLNYGEYNTAAFKTEGANKIRLENALEADEDGKLHNMVYIYVNDKFYGATLKHYVALTNKNLENADWIDQRNFEFNYLGATNGHELKGTFNYMTVDEGQPMTVEQLTYEPTYKWSEDGKSCTVTIQVGDETKTLEHMTNVNETAREIRTTIRTNYGAQSFTKTLVINLAEAKNYYFSIQNASYGATTINAVGKDGYNSNSATRVAGEIKYGGSLGDAVFSLKEAVRLFSDRPWTIEISVGKLTKEQMFLSKYETNSTANNQYLWANSSAIYAGEREHGTYVNYGVYSDVINDSAHIIRYINNVIETNGVKTNMISVYLDDVFVGELTNQDHNGAFTGVQTSAWVNGRDFVFNYLGANGHSLNGTYKYIDIQTCTHIHSTKNDAGHYICNYCEKDLGETDVHSYKLGENGAVWDDTACQMHLTCVNCAGTLTQNATVSTDVKAGVTNYVATCKVNNEVFTASKSVENNYIAQGGTSDAFFETLEEALASNSGFDTIRLLDGAVIDKNITIPKGKTLLLPYNNEDVTGINKGLTHDKTGEAYANTFTSGTSSTMAWNDPDCYLYAKATINSGVTVTVNGKLIVSGMLYHMDTTSQSHTSGNYAHLVNNGTIVLSKVDNSESSLFVTGLVTGAGRINLGSQGTLKLPFLINDFSGGNNMYALNDASEVLAMGMYAVNNVQCPVDMLYGAKVMGYGSLYVVSGPAYGMMNTGLIGPYDSTNKTHYFLNMESGSSVTINYDGNTKVDAPIGVQSTDFGKVQIIINYGSVTAGSFDYSYTYTIVDLGILGSVDFTLRATTEGKYLPIPYNFDIIVGDGSGDKATLNLSSNIKTKGYILMPGAELKVQNDGVLNVNSILQVLDGWNKEALSGKRHPSSMELQANGFAGSANLIVDGEMNIGSGATFVGIVQSTGTTGIINVADNAKLSGQFTNGTKKYSTSIYGVKDINLADNQVQYDLTACIYNGEEIVPMEDNTTYYAVQQNEEWKLDTFTMKGIIITKNADANGTVTINEPMTGTWARDFVLKVVNAGNVETSTTYSYGETITVPEAVVSEGVFMGWNTKADGSGDNYNIGDKIEITKELGAIMTLYAQWHIHDYDYIGGELVCKGDCGIEHPNADKLEGKVISIMGDSISTFAGCIPVDDGFNAAHAVYYSVGKYGVKTAEDTWWMQTVNALDATLGINESWSGSTVIGGEKAAMVSKTRIQNMGSNGTPDLILFYGATNDIGHLKSLGSFDETTARDTADLTVSSWNKLADAYAESILRMKYYYPDAKIIAMLPAYASDYYTAAELEQYSSVLAAICEHYEIPYIDLRVIENIGDYQPDKLHPNAEGMDLITDVLLDFVLDECGDMTEGKHNVYKVTHSGLSQSKASLHYYKGVSEGAKFEETITLGDNQGIIVTMGGENVTKTYYKDGMLEIPEVDGPLVISAHEHSYGEWQADEDKHWKECKFECGAITEEGIHTGGEATCTALATCETCGETYGETVEHEDVIGDGKHTCGNCDNEDILSECADTDNDHNCDECATKVSEHNYVDGTCTVCGGADPNAPIGTSVTGTIKAYNANNVPVVKLYVAGVEKYVAEIGEAIASGSQYTWTFTFSEVEKGIYDLVVVKDGHLTYTITDVQVDNEPLDLNEHSSAEISIMSMLCGDINGDGSINPTDINVIYQSGNYYKSVDVATNPIADLNGDGSINPTDINIIYQSAHYYKGVADCTVAY